MFCFYIVLSLIVTLKGQHYRDKPPGQWEFEEEIEAQLEELAKKPWVELNEERPDIGVNHPHCGRSVVPREQYLTFNQKCFKNSYSNITYVIYKTGQSRIEWERDTGIHSRILWGTDAVFGDAPWAVYVTNAKFANTWKFWQSFKFCSGTLITLEWVMTAAHCIDLNKYTYARVGIALWESGPWRWATKQFIHPEFLKEGDDPDIGLLKMNRPFPRTVKSEHYIINPVCLPKKKMGTFWHRGRNWFEGKYLVEGNIKAENVTAYGWGVSHGKDVPVLQRADMELRPNRECIPRTLCAEHPAQSPRPCFGDSGGGVLLQIPGRMAYLQVGIYSKMVGAHGQDVKIVGHCIPPEVPIKSHFANVALDMDWVLETITNN